MGMPIEAICLSQKPETITHNEVTCMFCGLPTPVPESGPIQFAGHVPRHISIVRCKSCGKEAPYLPGDIVESGATCRARRSPSIRN